jgi:TetR/AcrR family transcriptional regulator, tetracycline repressor protein
VVSLSRDEVVDAAVRLLDEVGLDALSLRRLAGTLGVSAPTLLWHVTDKRTLLDLVAQRIMAGSQDAAGPAPDEPWWAWLGDRMRAQYRALLAHRDAARVVAGNRPTADALPAIERVLDVLVGVGFPPGEAMEAVFTLGHFTLGSALEHQAEAARGATPPDPALVAALHELPRLSAVMSARVEPDPGATFDRGLTTILAGLRLRQAELTGSAGPDGSAGVAGPSGLAGDTAAAV